MNVKYYMSLEHFLVLFDPFWCNPKDVDTCYEAMLLCKNCFDWE